MSRKEDTTFFEVDVEHGDSTAGDGKKCQVFKIPALSQRRLNELIGRMVLRYEEGPTYVKEQDVVMLELTTRVTGGFKYCSLYFRKLSEREAINARETPHASTQVAQPPVVKSFSPPVVTTPPPPPEPEVEPGATLMQLVNENIVYKVS